MHSRSKTDRITTCWPRLEIYKQSLKKQRDFLFSCHQSQPYPWKVNRRNEAIYSQSCYFIFLSPSLPCLCWLRNYLELQTLCVNIAYNVTLNMQICTAQHLISHLSVKEPSVGSPGGPGLMSWRVPDRNMQKEREGTRVKEIVKEKEEGRRSKHPLADVCVQKWDSTFQIACNISQKVQRQIQEKYIWKWVDGWGRGAAILCSNLCWAVEDGELSFFRGTFHQSLRN